MPDDGNECWCGEGQELVGGYGVGEGAEVFLAVLLGVCQYIISKG